MLPRQISRVADACFPSQCGGTDLQPDQWVLTWNIASYKADSTCVSMTPDVSTAWVDEDPLPEGRVMGNVSSSSLEDFLVEADR